jgi:hypothetical protein
MPIMNYFAALIMHLPLYQLLLLTLFLASGICQGLQAQVAKKINTYSQSWLCYNGQERFSRKWGGWLDIQLYSKDKMLHWPATLEVRPGLVYYHTDDIRYAAGYAFINNYPVEGGNSISHPEHRAWQQVQWFTRYKKARTMQWVRLEERFVRKLATPDSLAGDYNYTWRARYNILLIIPLRQGKDLLSKFSFCLNNELFVNFGKNVVNNYFDQNRFFIGGAFQTGARDNLQVGYMNIFQQLPAGNSYRKTEVLRVSYFHNLDFRRE